LAPIRQSAQRLPAQGPFVGLVFTFFEVSWHFFRNIYKIVVIFAIRDTERRKQELSAMQTNLEIASVKSKGVFLAARLVTNAPPPRIVLPSSRLLGLFLAVQGGS
jgi:hypothetical protein